MEQYEASQAVMRGEMDSMRERMNQMMELMMAQHRREEERAANEAAAAVNDANAASNEANASSNAATVVNTAGLTNTANVTTVDATNDANRNVPLVYAGTPFPRVKTPNPLIFGMPKNFVPAEEGARMIPVAQAPPFTDEHNAREQPNFDYQANAIHDEHLQDEYHAQRCHGQGPIPVFNPAVTFQDVAAQKMSRDLAEQVKALKGKQSASQSALEMCLVPDVVIPPKFKVPDFEKYKGLTCPKNHLRMYCRKMVVHVRDQKLMMHCF